MITRKGAQLWVVSTAGTASLEWLRGKVDAGREAPQGRRTAYFEWSADPWADPATRPVAQLHARAWLHRGGGYDPRRICAAGQ
jgi:hypothetical protein